MEHEEPGELLPVDISGVAVDGQGEVDFHIEEDFVHDLLDPINPKQFLLGRGWVSTDEAGQDLEDREILLIEEFPLGDVLEATHDEVLDVVRI